MWLGQSSVMPLSIRFSLSHQFYRTDSVRSLHEGSAMPAYPAYNCCRNSTVN